MKIHLPFACAFIAAAFLSSMMSATGQTAQPVPPPPRVATPATAPPPPAQAASGPQGPPAEELARQITAARKFPITVDEMSRLDSVQGRGDTLTYNYTIVALPESREERLELSQRVKDGIDARACSTPDFAKLLAGGYTVALNYSFGAPDEDVHVRVTPRRCAR